MPIIGPFRAPFAGGSAPAALAPAPEIPFFPAGYKPQLSDFEQWVYDNFWFLTTRVVFRGRQTVSPQPMSGTPAALQLDTIDEDPYGGWDAATFAWTPPYDGWHQVTVTGWLATLTAGGVVFAGIAGATGIQVSEQNAQTAHGQGTNGTFWVYLLGGQDSITFTLAYSGLDGSPETSVTAGQISAAEVVWASF